MVARNKSTPIPIVNTMNREYRLIAFGVLAVVIIIALPQLGGTGLPRQLSDLFVFISIATMWNLLSGYAGMVSVGQQGWIGLGSYATIVIADDLGASLFVSVFLAGIFTALVSIPTSWVVFRLRAGYFAIGTWVVAEVFQLLVSSSTGWLGGGAGRSLASIRGFVRSTSPETFALTTYYVAAAIAVLSIIVVYSLMRSRVGLGLTAIRDSESGAASLGVNTTRLKLIAYVVAAGMTGIAGGIIAVMSINVRPDAAFSVQWTAFMIFITVIGGIGSIEGPIIGAVLFYFIRNQLSSYGEWSFIVLGVIAVVMMLVAPRGIWGLIQQRTHFEIFPIRRLMPRRLLMENTPSTGEAP
ncbi:MAG: branched-chain amino acid ABC transporter permease [Pleurocapsa minor GSE-CHR-MK-17-07R]|jgi:branched-chain amino acid transport system permease protein|nr:branched-chain amino acid ABC transporter permease [Pleurocapsa minor GSE-CHR-MK 17-07R]